MRVLRTLLPCALLTLSMTAAGGETPREQLKQMVEQLHKTPTDRSLREKIISIALEIKPRPAITEEVERHMARGTAGVKTATSSADFRAAAAEFDQAALAAPWYGDAYFNAGIAYSKAEDHSAAIRELKLYLLTSPSEADQKDARTRIFEEEFLTEKAAKTADAQLAAEREQRRRLVEGTWSSMGFVEFRVVPDGNGFALRDLKLTGSFGVAQAVGVAVDPQRIRFSLVQPACPQCGNAVYDLSLSPSGTELTGTIDTQSGGKQDCKFTRVP